MQDLQDSLASYQFTFLFDPTQTWQRASELEKDLADWLNSLGLEAKRIKSQGQPGIGNFLITRKEESKVHEVGRMEAKGTLRESRGGRPRKERKDARYKVPKKPSGRKPQLTRRTFIDRLLIK